jgi:hypothetical protein
MFEKGWTVFWVYLSYSFASCWPLSRVDCAEAAASCVWVDDQSTTGGGVDRMKDTHTQVYIISLCRPFSNSSRQSSFVSFNGPTTPSTSIPLFFFLLGIVGQTSLYLLIQLSIWKKLFSFVSTWVEWLLRSFWNGSATHKSALDLSTATIIRR